MPIYKIVCKIDTYGEVEVEAADAETAEAMASRDECTWDYQTDWDSSVNIEVEEVGR